MKNRLLLVLLFTNVIVNAQYDVGAGMGLNFFTAPDLRDYVNSSFASSDEMGSFNTSADFFGEFGFNLNDKFQLALMYNFNIYSFNTSTFLGVYDLQINRHEPSLIGYYQILGNGYKFKMGAGAGYRIGKAEEKQPGTTEKINYNSNGFGVLLKLQGDTKLSSNFYALITGEMRYDLYEDIETITHGVNFNLSSFGVALKLGVVYHF